jgi:hypothetical protein
MRPGTRATSSASASLQAPSVPGRTQELPRVTLGAPLCTDDTCQLQFTGVSKVVRSETFDRWLRKLKDRRAAARVLVRIDRLAAGNLGDVRPVGEGISELRINYGLGLLGLPTCRTATS